MGLDFLGILGTLGILGLLVILGNLGILANLERKKTIFPIFSHASNQTLSSS